jgi:hypothetical protein
MLGSVIVTDPCLRVIDYAVSSAGTILGRWRQLKQVVDSWGEISYHEGFPS